MVEPSKVVDVPAMSDGVVKARSDAFCHFVTFPVLPLKVRLAGELPEQMVCAVETVPPTEVGLTLKVIFCAKVTVQLGEALVVVIPVICKVCKLLTAVRIAEEKLPAPEPSATTPVAGVWAAPFME